MEIPKKKTKSVEEAPEKAHLPRSLLTIPNCKHHRTQRYSRVIVPGPYRPDRGVDGRKCGGFGPVSPQVLRAGEVSGGRRPEPLKGVGGWFGCNRATGREPGEGRERCAQSCRSTRVRGLKRDHNFSTMPTMPNSTPRRQCSTREQSHRGHHFEDNLRLRPTH